MVKLICLKVYCKKHTAALYRCDTAKHLYCIYVGHIRSEKDISNYPYQYLRLN